MQSGGRKWMWCWKAMSLGFEPWMGYIWAPTVISYQHWAWGSTPGPFLCANSIRVFEPIANFIRVIIFTTFVLPWSSSSVFHFPGNWFFIKFYWGKEVIQNTGDLFVLGTKKPGRELPGVTIRCHYSFPVCYEITSFGSKRWVRPAMGNAVIYFGWWWYGTNRLICVMR